VGRFLGFRRLTSHCILPLDDAAWDMIGREIKTFLKPVVAGMRLSSV
jgi:hypothetical protein